MMYDYSPVSYDLVWDDGQSLGPSQWDTVASTLVNTKGALRENETLYVRLRNGQAIIVRAKK